jgi:hypothetical protein
LLLVEHELPLAVIDLLYGDLIHWRACRTTEIAIPATL